MITVVKSHEFDYLCRMARLNQTAMGAGYDSHEHAMEVHREHEKMRRRKVLAAMRERRRREFTPFIA